MILSLDRPKWEKHLYSPYRFKILFGGRGSRKSFPLADAAIIHTFKKEFVYIICARSNKVSLKKSVFGTICKRIKDLNLENIFKINQSEIKNLQTGNIIHFEGLGSSVENIKSISFITHFWIEEGSHITANAWDIILPTVREKNSEIWVSMNPKFKTDILYKTFFYKKDRPENTFYRFSTYKDNPFLSDTIKKDIIYLKNKDINKYNHIYGGECLTINQAQVYYNKYKKIKIENVPDNLEILYGLDFGYKIDPLAVLKCGIDHTNNILYIIKELYMYHVELKDYVKHIKKTFGSIYAYADNARPDVINFINNGENDSITLEPCFKSKIIDGVDIINSFEEIRVVDNCTNTFNEFETYCYKTDKNSDELTNIIEDKNNHAMDAMRYALSDYIKHRLHGELDISVNSDDKSWLL